MPIYVFKCQLCGHKWDSLCKMDTSVQGCPKCASGVGHRQVTAPSWCRIKGWSEKNGYGLRHIDPDKQ